MTTLAGARESTAPVTVDEDAIERGWTERFARSGEKLTDLARQARAQEAAGETTDLIFTPEA